MSWPVLLPRHMDQRNIAWHRIQSRNESDDFFYKSWIEYRFVLTMKFKFTKINTDFIKNSRGLLQGFAKYFILSLY